MTVLCCDQIRVNSVNPTVVMTEMGRLGWSNPEKAKIMTSRIPLGRFAGESKSRLHIHMAEFKCRKMLQMRASF